MARASDQQDLKRWVEYLWVAFKLGQFWDHDSCQSVDWEGYFSCHAHNGRIQDEWLYQKLPLTRKRFRQKWLLFHVQICPHCSVLFGLGLDGKRGMRRFVCASLDGLPENVSFLDIDWCQPCHRLPRPGGLYCKDHEPRHEDHIDPLTCICAHRRTEAGDLQYRLCTRENEGDEHQSTGCLGVHEWVPAEEVNGALRHLYETGRLPTKKEKGINGGTFQRTVRQKVGSTPNAAHGIPCLEFQESDAGPCAIDKTTQGSSSVCKKYQRRRLGGIIAAVTGCRIILDFREHHGGEGASDTYLLLGDCMKTILDSIAEGGPGRIPDVIFNDNGCTLRQYAINVVRAARTYVTRAMAKLHYMIDIWHVSNHSACLVDPASRAILDPRHTDNAAKRAAVNTEACEQVFSFVDQVTYVAFQMGPGMFHTYAYLLFDLENEKTERRRS